MQQWMILLSPEGAARQISLQILQAFQKTIAHKKFPIFDTKKYLSTYDHLLKTPNDDLSVDLMNQSLIVQCIQYEVTHLFVPALSPVTLFTLNLLEKLHIIKIHWFFENFQRASYWKEVIKGYTHFLTVQKIPVTKSEYKKISYVPTATSEETLTFGHQKGSELKEKDCIFIGIPSLYRIELLEHLATSNITLCIAGQGWNTYSGPLVPYIVTSDWIDHSQSLTLMNKSRIAINLSIQNPIHESEYSQLSPRIFDILALNTILLTEDNPLLHEILEPCTYFTFTDKDSALKQIHTILSTYKKMDYKKIWAQNREYIAANHTWSHRVTCIVNEKF